MRYEQDMRIVFPEGASSCRNVLTGSCLGEEGHIYSIQHSEYDFTKVPAVNRQSAVKYYMEEKV